MFEVNGIVYANEYNSSLKIVDAKVTDYLMMLITFSNKEKRVFDASILTGSAFKPLEDMDTFKNFKIVHGAITWMNEEIDCAPEYIYEHSYAYEEIGVKKSEDDIMTDDEFCENLYQHYLNSKDKDESYTLEECKKEWHIDTAIPDK